MKIVPLIASFALFGSVALAGPPVFTPAPASGGVAIGNTGGTARDAGQAIAAEQLAQATANAAIPNTKLGTYTVNPGAIMLPGNYQGAGIPYYDTSNRLILTNLTDAPAGQFADLEIYKNALNETAGGISFALNVQTFAGANHTNQEWNGFFQVKTAGTKHAQALAITSDAIKTAGNDQTWDFLGQNQDETGNPSSVAGSDLGAEWDISANGADDGTNSTTYGGVGLRKMFQFAFNRQTVNSTGGAISNGGTNEFSSELWTATDPTVFVDQFAGFSPGTQIINALDCRGIVKATNAGVTFNPICMNMAAGDSIDFAGGPTLKSGPQYALSYSTADAAWEFAVGATPEFKFGSAGVLVATGGVVDNGYETVGTTLQVAGLQTDSGGFTNNGTLVENGTIQSNGSIIFSPASLTPSLIVAGTNSTGIFLSGLSSTGGATYNQVQFLANSAVTNNPLQIGPTTGNAWTIGGNINMTLNPLGGITLAPGSGTTAVTGGETISGPLTVSNTASAPFLATNSTGTIGQAAYTPDATEVDTFAASGTWTKNANAKWIKVFLIGCGSSGAGGVSATAGTAYSGGAGGSAAIQKVYEGPASSFPTTASVTICTAPAGGAAGASGVAGGSSVFNGITAWGAGAPSAGSTAASASGGGAGANAAGNNASGATAGTGGSAFSIPGASGAVGVAQGYPGLGSSGGGDALSSGGSTGGFALAGPTGGGAGAGMAATQALLVGGAGGSSALTFNASGGATAGANGAAGTNTLSGYGVGGGGGANNPSGVGGAGGAGGYGAGGGGGGDGSTGGGAGGNGGGGYMLVDQY